MMLWNRLKVLTLPLLSVFGTACTPSLTHEGRLTEVIKAEHAIQCRHIGNNQITLQGPVLFSNTPEKQTQALLAEARNLAGKIGADTVVPIGNAQNKQQAFKFYICKPDN